MKIDNQFHVRVRNISEDYLFNFFFLDVDIFLIKQGPHPRLHTCIENIAVEGTVSQNFDISPGSLFIKSRKKYF